MTESIISPDSVAEQSSDQQRQLPVPSKRLEGIRMTEKLARLFKEAVEIACDESKITDSDDDNDSVPGLSAETSLPLLSPISLLQARQIVLDFEQQHFSNNPQPPRLVPIPVVRSIAFLLNNDAVENCLSSTTLVFSNPGAATSSDELSSEQLLFRQRLCRLRNREQEGLYKTLIDNVGGHAISAALAKNDDVTTRSMTYAASIGLNMIIAPLSFGCFLYFFGGGLLDYFFPESEESIDHRRKTNGPKIGRLLVAIIGGVLMMFIEMLLFVIRTHEMDKAMRKKEKKKGGQGAFGYYTSQTSKTFTSQNTKGKKMM